MGFHLIIDREGHIHCLRAIDLMGCHAPGYNDESVGLCLLGGLDARERRVDNFTTAQRTTLETVCCAFLRMYPTASIKGLKELGGYRKKSDNPTLNVKALRDRLIMRRIQRVRPLDQLLARGTIRRHEPPISPNPGLLAEG